MYIEKFKINKFRVLEDIEIRFQPPGGATADPETGNVVNVIAGVNGCGKTSLLEAIFRASNLIHGLPDFNADELILDREKTIFNLDHGIESDTTKTIFLPAKQSMAYQPVLKFPISSFIRLDSDAVLGNAEFYIKEYIVAREREIYVSDPEIRSAESVRLFNHHFDDVGLLTRLCNLDKNQFNRPVFKSANGGLVTIDKLSDGEKQLYGRVITLMMLGLENSIILIDEPEIALHPAWQQKIMQIYNRIGKNNQFIVATHSPQVIVSVRYKNRIFLHKNSGKIDVVHCNQPPSGLDVNSILSEVMGADPRPPELLKLYMQYRKFVEERKENTPEALAVKAQLSEESDHSQFMQEMNFLIELRDL